MRKVSRRRFVERSGAALLCSPFLALPVKAWIREEKLKTDVSPDVLIGGLSKLLPRLMEKHRVPGVSIAIIRDARLLWTKGFGVTSKTTKEPVSIDTIFEAASLSKPAFAYAALNLFEKRGLGLDTPLTNFLPEPFIKNEPNLKLVTARMALSHTSGLPHGRPAGTPITLRFTPGKQFYYSATGFQYLQKVIEHVSGQPLTDFMRSNVLEPFGMENSSFGWLDRFQGAAAEGYNKDGEPGLSGNGRYLKMTTEERAQLKRDYPEYTDTATASAGLYTTAMDFAKFMIAIIAPAREDRFRLSPQLTTEMLKPQMRLTDKISWGLGWGIEHTSAGDAFWHWGDWGVFRNFAVAFKESRIGVVVLTNSFNGPGLYAEAVPEAIGSTHPAFSWVNNYRR